MLDFLAEWLKWMLAPTIGVAVIVIAIVLHGKAHHSWAARCWGVVGAAILWLLIGFAWSMSLLVAYLAVMEFIRLLKKWYALNPRSEDDGFRPNPKKKPGLAYIAWSCLPVALFALLIPINWGIFDKITLWTGCLLALGGVILVAGGLYLADKVDVDRNFVEKKAAEVKKKVHRSRKRKARKHLWTLPVIAFTASASIGTLALAWMPRGNPTWVWWATLIFTCASTLTAFWLYKRETKIKRGKRGWRLSIVFAAVLVPLMAIGTVWSVVDSLNTADDIPTAEELAAEAEAQKPDVLEETDQDKCSDEERMGTPGTLPNEATPAQVFFSGSEEALMYALQTTGLDDNVSGPDDLREGCRLSDLGKEKYNLLIEMHDTGEIDLEAIKQDLCTEKACPTN